jgi:hypothetical protein
MPPDPGPLMPVPFTAPVGDSEGFDEDEEDTVDDGIVAEAVAEESVISVSAD